MAVQHPLIDDVVGSALVVDAAGPVVELSEPLDTLLRRAARAGETVVLRTHGDAALTPALRHALNAARAGWAVVDADGRMRDGRTGVRAISEEDFAVRGAELVGPIAPEHRDAAGAVAQISVDLTLRHRHERSVDIGSAVEELCAAVGVRPTMWGTSEPLAAAWDRWVVTQYAKHRAPGVSASYAAGEGVSAAVTAWMRGDAVIETVSAVLTAAADRVDDILQAVRRIGEQVRPVFGVVLCRSGDADHLVRAVSYGAPEPVAVVVGADALEMLDRGEEWPPPGVRLEPFSGGAHDGVIARFDDGWPALEALLERLDDTQFLRLVGEGPLDTAPPEGHQER